MSHHSEVANFDAVKEHLERYLSNHSSGGVLAYLEGWASRRQELNLLLSGNYVQYPSASDMLGYRGEAGSLALPWIFTSNEAADQFCNLVEQAFRSAGIGCIVAGRVGPD